MSITKTREVFQPTKCPLHLKVANTEKKTFLCHKSVLSSVFIDVNGN